MSKIKKINSAKVVLPSVIIFFAAILILSLPVLLNYNSIQNVIEKKISSEFKINLKILDDISLKLFPRPHYLVKKAILDLNSENDESSTIQINNLKILMPINKLYSRSNIKIEGIEIEKANIYFKFDDVLDFRNHLYYKINKPIYIKKSKFFLIDKNDKTILISPINNIKYLINTKSNSKELIIKGNIFDVDFNSYWKRSYIEPQKSLSEIKFKNPNLSIKNFFSFRDKKNFNGQSLINFLNETISISYVKNDNRIIISSPDLNNNQKIKLSSKIELEPFNIDSVISIDSKDGNFLIDNLFYVILNSKEFLGNINGNLTLDLRNLKNSIIDSGKINFSIKEKTIKLEESFFEIEGIGKLKSDFRYYENEGELIFASENVFEIKNKKNFSRKFQISQKKLKNINKIYFDLEKNIDSNEISISNIYLNKIETKNFSEQYYIIQNLQILKKLIRKLII